jgi:dinuclear metal center YbgI/SA1388 family protein
MGARPRETDYTRAAMNVADLVRALDSIAPLAHAEEWDNVGLLAGDPASSLTRALLCIDCTRDVVLEAEKTRCEAIVAYHPPLFRPISRVTRGSIVYDLVRRGLALYSPHTALDAADGGTNDVLADAIGMTDERAPIRPTAPKATQHKLVTFVPPDALAKVSDALFEAGAGRIGDYRGCSFRAPGTGTFFGEAGTLPAVGSAEKNEVVEEVRLETVVPIDRVGEVVRALRASHPYEEPAFDLVALAPLPPLPFARVARGAQGGPGMGRIGTLARIERAALLARVKERLGVPHLLVAGPTAGTVTRGAVCAGAAGDLLDAAIRLGAEVIVAGEVRHHDALRAAEAGVTVVCALHSNSERITLEPLRLRLASALPALELATSRADRDPFAIV